MLLRLGLAAAGGPTASTGLKQGPRPARGSLPLVSPLVGALLSWRCGFVLWARSRSRWARRCVRRGPEGLLALRSQSSVGYIHYIFIDAFQ